MVSAFMFVVSYLGCIWLESGSWLVAWKIFSCNQDSKFHGVPDILFKNMSLPAHPAIVSVHSLYPIQGRLGTRNCWKKLSGQTLFPPKQGCGKIGRYFTNLYSVKFMNDLLSSAPPLLSRTQQWHLRRS